MATNVNPDICIPTSVSKSATASKKEPEALPKTVTTSIHQGALLPPGSLKSKIISVLMHQNTVKTIGVFICLLIILGLSLPLILVAGPSGAALGVLLLSFLFLGILITKNYSKYQDTLAAKSFAALREELETVDRSLLSKSERLLFDFINDKSHSRFADLQNFIQLYENARCQCSESQFLDQLAIAFCYKTDGTEVYQTIGENVLLELKFNQESYSLEDLQAIYKKIVNRSLNFHSLLGKIIWTVRHPLLAVEHVRQNSTGADYADSTRFGENIPCRISREAIEIFTTGKPNPTAPTNPTILVGPGLGDRIGKDALRALLGQKPSASFLYHNSRSVKGSEGKCTKLLHDAAKSNQQFHVITPPQVSEFPFKADQAILEDYKIFLKTFEDKFDQNHIEKAINKTKTVFGELSINKQNWPLFKFLVQMFLQEMEETEAVNEDFYLHMPCKQMVDRGMTKLVARLILRKIKNSSDNNPITFTQEDMKLLIGLQFRAFVVEDRDPMNDKTNWVYSLLTFLTKGTESKQRVQRLRDELLAPVKE